MKCQDTFIEEIYKLPNNTENMFTNQPKICFCLSKKSNICTLFFFLNWTHFYGHFQGKIIEEMPDIGFL